MAQYRNDQLTKAIKDIFGEDIVSDVWAIVPDLGDKWFNSQERIQNAIDRISYDVRDVSYDTTPLMIVFVNGKQVQFSASEWASITGKL